MDARRPQPVIVTVTEAGAATAERAAAAVAGRVVATGADAAPTAETLRALFAAGTPIIGVCAAGILIRALAPLVGAKQSDPPVIAVSADGASVAPLLGGHHGANDLAERLATALGGHAAITTLSETSHGAALDAPPPGWRLAATADQVKRLAAAAPLAEAITVEGAGPWAEQLAGAFGVSPEPSPGGAVLVEARRGGEVARVAYHAQRYALGVGCARGCPAAELEGLARETLAAAGVDPAAVAGVFSIDVKADEAAVLTVAGALKAPMRFFTAEELEREAPRLATPSEVVFAEVGCHGVAEGAALAGAGPEARLVAPKRKTAMATVAIAEAPAPILEPAGRARGRLSVIGIGPGQSDWRTPEASKLVAEAEELVGYGLYIDLLGPLGAHKPRADFPLGGEEDRCRYALEEAGKGRDIALICSGDAGIYAMGALVMELIDRGGGPGGVSPAARRAELVMAPGITALQAASARAGALIGHDFCAISLSDLLTPRDDILKRLEAAAAGDFVVAFYNPVSKRRRDLLATAREILLAHRPGDTPVLLAHSLGRPEERLERRRLDQLSVDEVDMLTVVLVGSAQSRCFDTGDGGWRMYTPRGYAKKLETQR